MTVIISENNTSTVSRIGFDTLTPTLFYRHYRKPGRPVVITGGLAGTRDWTLDFLSQQLGDTRFLTRHYGKDHFKRPKREWAQYSTGLELAFDKYAQMLRDRTAHEEHIYLAQMDIGNTPLAAAIRPSMDDLAQRCGMVAYPPSDLNIWLGPAGHTEPLHFDGGDGTLMQLHGAKKILLFPPTQMTNVYPFPFIKSVIPPWFSQVDTDRPDFAAFPGFRAALDARLELVLEAGEILYIPASWWHQVTALGDDYVCSVNRFWKVKPMRRNFCSQRSAMLYLINRLPWSLIMRLHTWVRKWT